MREVEPLLAAAVAHGLRRAAQSMLVTGTCAAAIGAVAVRELEAALILGVYGAAFGAAYGLLLGFVFRHPGALVRRPPSS